VPHKAMKRRAFITLLGGAAVWPLAARAPQPGKVPTIGVLSSGTRTRGTWALWVAAFVQRLRELGWTEGRTIAIEYRWAEGRSEAGWAYHVYGIFAGYTDGCGRFDRLTGEPREAARHAHHHLDCRCALGVLDGEQSLHGFCGPRQISVFDLRADQRQPPGLVGEGAGTENADGQGRTGGGGAVVNVLAYKGDYVAANEELQVLDLSARAKNCENPANWRSNSAVQ
jgi:hypothetical protein